MSTSSDAMEDRQYVTLTMPGPWVDTIDGELRGTDSRSEWIREAIRQRMEREDIN